MHDVAAVQARHPLLIAHRGGVITPSTPENTLAAMHLAASHGYDMVELDVSRSRDDEPILFHDATGSLLMNCGIPARLADLTAQELTTIHYRASEEPIATLAQGFALCQQRRLGVMLDIKIAVDTPRKEGFVRRIRELLEDYGLTLAAVSISSSPLLGEVLAKHVLFPVTTGDVRHVSRGDTPGLRGRFWFGLPEELPDPLVPVLQRAGVLVVPAINIHRYPRHANDTLARADIGRLRRAQVDGFQIDSVYGTAFWGGEPTM
jgi:hypothetical protein